MNAAAIAPKPKRSDLGVRTVTGLALILVALFAVAWGQTPFWLLLSVAALVMLAEWASMIAAERWQMWLSFVGLTLALLVEQPHLDIPDVFSPFVLAAAAALVAAVTRNLRLAAGMLYAGLPTLSLFFLHGQYDGIDLTLWTLAIVWATDIGAYFAGRRFGGAKLAPAISPNKTWAGLIGGIAAAGIVGLALAIMLRLPLRLAGFGGLLAIAAQAGDLYESAMKRRAGVKDSGAILPGHGGAMDRLDGVVPVACLVAAIVASGAIG
ncbi:phosphatidate cytidylyltransferase [Sphingomonas sp.]|uniref:phosphatidate cytidylyltransferase n=1 Tax=Sphingomonas sp. TaxID=28214 RepID=UPI003AFFD2EE